eukprot:1189803-Prorocentrum_minimum.AAC.1
MTCAGDQEQAASAVRGPQDGVFRPGSAESGPHGRQEGVCRIGTARTTKFVRRTNSYAGCPHPIGSDICQTCPRRIGSDRPGVLITRCPRRIGSDICQT